MGDFTGDGKLDVLTDSWGNNRINLLAGDGQGNLMLPGRMLDVGKRPYHRLRSADFNKDGHPDIVTTNQNGNDVSILLGDGRGGFHVSAFATGEVPWDMAIDDLDRDGNLDLVTIPYSPEVKDPSGLAVTILRGEGNGGFAPMRPVSRLPLPGCERSNRVAAGDINGDGFRDLVISCLDGSLAMFLGSKDGSFQSVRRRVGDKPYGLAIGDLNGDGKDDIVVANSGDGTITILLSR